MTLVEQAIKRPVITWMFMVVVLVAGIFSFRKLGVSQLPDVDFPMLSISASIDGASPQSMEQEVVSVIENAVSGIAGVKGISSSASTGRGQVTVELEVSKNIDLVQREIESGIAQVRNSMPAAMDPIIVNKSNPEDSPILWLGVSSTKMSRIELSAYVKDQIKPLFTQIEGINDVMMAGSADPQVQILVRPQALMDKSLTVTDVLQVFRTEHIDLPGGKLEGLQRDIPLRFLGEVDSVKALAQLPILSRGGGTNFQTLRIRDVSEVRYDASDNRRMSRVNGVPSVGLGFTKERGSNAVEVADRVLKLMESLKPSLPEGTSMRVNFDTTQFIREAVEELEFTLLLSVVLTSLVCWMFLGSWSSTFNVLLSIPMSVSGTLIALYFLDFTLNTFTLLALSLSLGIVVDDAIMVLENIIRHFEMKKNRVRASIEGTREITLAALAATFSIIAVFLPVAFMKGIIGQYFYQFGVTLSVAVIFSLIEALTLTPLRCAQFISISERRTWIGRGFEKGYDAVENFYRISLQWSLRHPWFIILSALTLFGSSFWLGKKLKSEFVPAQDQGRLMVRLILPPGTPITVTDQKTQEAEKILMALPEIDAVYSTVGGFSSSRDGSFAMIFISLKPKTERKKSQQVLMPEFRKALSSIKGTRIVIQDPSIRGFSPSRGFPIEFTLRGPDWDGLKIHSEHLLKQMEDSGRFADIDMSLKLGQKEILVTPNREAALRYGVNISQIAQSIQVLMGGYLVGKITIDGLRKEIRVRMHEDARREPSDLNKITIRNQRGEAVPFRELVTWKEESAVGSFTRRDQERAVTFYANLKHGTSVEGMDYLDREAKNWLPAGYRIVRAGTAESQKESFSSLLFALYIGLAVAYLVLVAQFNSLIDPWIVLIALPFSLSGAAIGLFVSNQTINIYSLIGLVLLMGIVKKNSILLVDFTRRVFDENPTYSWREAILNACPIRLRPILMTSVATIAGAIPAAIAFGPGAETRIPMATAIIGGVFFSTLLTLFVVPCVYAWFPHKRLKY